MIEPTLALQTAIRGKLIETPAVLALVPAAHIRSGTTRPDKPRCIIMADGSTTLHGHDYRAQRAAWVYLDVHVWAKGEGEEKAKEIAFAVQNALDKRLEIDGGYLDSFKIVRTVFPRDPEPEYGHGVLSVEALVRWIV